MRTLPEMSVIVNTCDRPDLASATVESILSSDYPSFELIVIDQSAGSDTRVRLAALAQDRRLRVAASAHRGLSAGRNIGVRLSRGTLLAFTDDDCVVESDWLRSLAEPFLHDGEIGVLFGEVRAAAYDREAGFILAYRPRGFRVEHRVRNKALVEGIGACMALRRATWARLGGFDEMLGVGAPFLAGEDTDLTVRALLAGYAVCETPDAAVTHFGFRRWNESRRVICDYMFGLGAVNTKMLRLARYEALVPIRSLAWRWLAGRPAADLNHLPSRSLRLISFLRGCRAAARLGLGSRTGHFIANKHGVRLAD